MLLQCIGRSGLYRSEARISHPDKSGRLMRILASTCNLTKEKLIIFVKRLQFPSVLYSSIFIVIAFLIILSSHPIFSLPSQENIKLKIRYLNLKIVNVSANFLNKKDYKEINVVINNSGISNAFIKIHNKYQSFCGENFLPFIYVKEINQSNYQEQQIIQYNHNKKEALRKDLLNGIDNKYLIKSNTYDFFSAFFKLRDENLQLNDTISFFVDANASIWKAQADMLKRERLETKIGTFNTIKCLVRFKRISKEESKTGSDILTNNLVSERNKLYFWFSDDEKHIPLKAVYDMFPFNIVWKIEDYQCSD